MISYRNRITITSLQANNTPRITDISASAATALTLSSSDPRTTVTISVAMGRQSGHSWPNRPDSIVSFA